MFDLDDDSTRNNVAWFVAHCEFCVQDIETVILVIRVS